MVDVISDINSNNKTNKNTDTNENQSQSTCYMQFKEDMQRFNNNELCTYVLAKRNIDIIYITHFLPLIISLWKSICKEDFLVISSSTFKG